MKIVRDMGWREIGASAALHGSLLGLALTLASAAGPGPRFPGAPGESGGLSGGGGPQVFPVALLAGKGGGATGTSLADDVLRPGEAPEVSASASQATTLESVPPAERATDHVPLPAPETSVPESRPDAGRAAVAPMAATQSFPQPVEAASGEEFGAVADVAAARTGESAANRPGDGGPAAGANGAISGAGVSSGTGSAPGPGGSDVVPPSPLHISIPALPRGVDAGQARGPRVRLLIYVTELGEVSEVKLLSGTGIADLDASAIKAAWRMRYVPGSKAGRPTAMWSEAEVHF